MLKALPGFRDFYPEDCAFRNACFKKWRSVARRFAFLEFDSPVLEALELFTEKSGEEIAEQLFAFEDRGGRKVALRPEMTPSLVRLVSANMMSCKLPIKWFNITENFRYERPQKGRLRSFYQFNVDIVGEPSFQAEAELISLAVESFKIFGLDQRHFYVRLSDRQLWMLWLQTCGFSSEDERLKVLGILDKWERRKPEDLAQDLGTVMEKAQVEAFVAQVNTLRSLKNLADIRQFFTQTQGNFNEAIESRLKDWEQLLEALKDRQCADYVRIDLGIVRGLAYYTGFVFEVFDADLDGRALAGGGRYDQLFEKLTGRALPAVGFAAGDVTLGEILKKHQLVPPTNLQIDCFVVFEPSVRVEVFKDIYTLRAQNISVSYVLNEPCSVSKQLKKAFDAQPRFILFYAATELAQGKVQVHDTVTQEKTWVERNRVLEVLSGTFNPKTSDC